MDSESRLNVVVAGGGVAGLEALLALRDIAGERVDLTLLEPAGLDRRPLTVGPRPRPSGTTALGD